MQELNSTNASSSKVITDLQISINKEKLIRDISTYFSHNGWLKELFQNAVRAGATSIHLRQDDHSLSLTDNGQGIENNPSAWEPLLGISTSAWNQTIQAQQNPAGMGLLSALTRFPALMQSKGWAVRTQPEMFTNARPIPLFKDGNTINGFRITMETGIIITNFASTSWDSPPCILKNQTGAFLHPQNRPDEDLSITAEIDTSSQKKSYQGTMRNAPWALSTLDHKIKTCKLQKPVYKNWILQSIETEVPVLRERHNGFDIWAATPEYSWKASCELNIYNINYFGMPIHWASLHNRETTTQIRISIHGNTGYNLELKKPDRESLIENKEARRFFLEKVKPFMERAGKWETFHTKVQMPYEILDENQKINPFFDNDSESRNITINQLEGQLKDMGFDSLPDLKTYTDKVTQNGPLDFVTKEFKYHKSCDELKLDEKKSNSTLKIGERQTIQVLHMLASEKALRCGVQHHRPDTLPYTDIPGHPEIPVIMPMVFIKKPENTLNIPTTQGGHKILIAQFGVQNPVNGQKWTVKKPGIFCEFDNSNYHECRNFVANPAWDALRRERPLEAYQLFLQAAEANFYEDEEAEYNSERFSTDFAECYEIAKSFFLVQNPEDILLKLLKEEMPKHIPQLHRYGKWTIKKIHIEPEKRITELEIENQVEDTQKVNACYKNNAWKVTNRQPNQKKPGGDTE
jgi:hypothetical protein